MNYLHIPTVLAMQAVVTVACSLDIFLLWRQSRGRYPGLQLWCLSYSLFSSGAVLFVLRGLVPDLVSMVAANLLVMAGMVSLYAGLARFGGIAAGHRLNLAALAVFGTILYHFSLVAPFLPARTLNVNFFLLFFFWRCAWLMRRGFPPELLHASKLPAYTLAVLGAICLLRIVLVMAGNPALDFMTQRNADSAFLMLYSALMVLLTAGLSLLVNRRLEADMRVDLERRLSAEAALRAAVKVARLGTWEWDIRTGGISWSEEMSAITGVKPSEFSGGMPAIQDRFIYPEDRAAVRAAGAAAIAGDIPRGVEHRVVRPGGVTGWVYTEAFELVRDADGAPALLRGYAQDITEHKAAETALQSAQKLESLGTLAGGIAHDFNNLLTGIAGNISLLRSCPGGDREEMLMEADSACETARGLARQLLTFSSGGAPVKSALDICALARECLSFSLRGTAVKGEMASAPGRLAVMGDREQLFQALNNLVINAAQSMDGKGAVGMAVRAAALKAGEVPPLQPGEYALLEVSDQGRGISPDMMGRIFDPYFSTKSKGRGLGLAVCRSIVLRHGGQITAVSAEGKGSRFSIYLPLTSETPPAAGEAPVQVHRGVGRVLIMEDEPVVSALLERMLSVLGYQPEVVLNGEMAVEAWRGAMKTGKPFAAAVLDLTISGGPGGAETVKRIRGMEPAAKVIASSGYADDPVMAGCRDYGFDAALPKPYRVADVSRVFAGLSL